MVLIVRANSAPNWKLVNGSSGTPALSFPNGGESSGMFFGNNQVRFSVNGVPKLSAGSSNIIFANTVYAMTLGSNIDASVVTTGTLSAARLNATTFGTAETLYIGNGSQLTGVVQTMSVSNIQITDASFSLVDDLAVDTVAGGYLRINGIGFGAGSIVLLGGSMATATTVVSTTQIRVQVPPKSSGTYDISVVRPDGQIATLPLAISYSPAPVWSTSTLANVTKTIAFSQTLAATEAMGATVTYSVVAGSSLPPGVSLTGGGILSGNITTDSGNTTIYSFTIEATDGQYQGVSRTFSLNALSYLTLRRNSLIWIDMSTATNLTDIVNLSLSTSKLANPTLQNNGALSFDTSTGRKTLSIINPDITSWQNQGGYIYWSPGSLDLRAGFMVYLRFYFVPVSSSTFSPNVLFYLRNTGGTYPNWIDNEVFLNPITGEILFNNELSFINTSTSNDTARTLIANAYNTVSIYYDPSTATFKVRVNEADCIVRTNITVKNAPQNLGAIKNINIGRSDEIQGAGFVRNIKLYRFALLNAYDAGLFNTLESIEFFSY
jgi:hypothetical protein